MGGRELSLHRSVARHRLGAFAFLKGNSPIHDDIADALCLLDQEVLPAFAPGNQSCRSRSCAGKPPPSQAAVIDFAGRPLRDQTCGHRGVDAAGFRTAIYAGLDVGGPLYAAKTEFGTKFREMVATEGVPAAVRRRAAQFKE
jgi:hypothetical protein